MDWKEHFEMMFDMHDAHVWGRCLANCAFCAANSDMIVVTAAQRERMIREEFEEWPYGRNPLRSLR